MLQLELYLGRQRPKQWQGCAKHLSSILLDERGSNLGSIGGVEGALNSSYGFLPLLLFHRKAAATATTLCLRGCDLGVFLAFVCHHHRLLSPVIAFPGPKERAGYKL